MDAPVRNTAPSHRWSSQVLTTTDYPELPAVTFRSIFLGLGFSAFGAYVPPISSFTTDSSCAPTPVCSHRFIISSPRASRFRLFYCLFSPSPLATLCTPCCPRKAFSGGSTPGPSTVSAPTIVLDPHRDDSRVTVKEHAAIVIMASTASTSATAIQVIAVQERA